jgi:hypothetical protein
MGAHGRPVRRPHHEQIPAAPGVLDGAMTDLDVRVLPELTLPALTQVRRLHPVMPEQPADALGNGVRRPVVVHHEHPLPRPAQHERRAQARRPTAHDHRIVRRGTPGIEVMEAGGHDNLDATTAGNHPWAGRFGG